ncbi:MAG: hypothetical protein ACRCTQ_01425 [Brevinemataceae bacterium]
MKRRSYFIIGQLLSLIFLTSHLSAQMYPEDTSYQKETTPNYQQPVSEKPSTTKPRTAPATYTPEADPFHFGVWINYQQQFGALDNKFFTVGGPSVGFNLGKHFLIGGGVYSSFGYLTSNDGLDKNALLYGGGIVGFRWNPDSPIVFRTQVLIGAAAFDTINENAPECIVSRHTSLIVVPEIAFDIRIVKFLFLSLSVSYRYVQDLPSEWSSFQGLGALSGNASLGFSF